MTDYTLPLALIGFLALFFFILDRVWSLLQACRAILAPLFIPNEDNSLITKFGHWALITGCTDGIGKAYAFELARRGVNIVLVSRNEEKLKNTAGEIESKFSVKTKIIAADFSLGYKAVEIVKKEVGKLQIDILVNNVGKNYAYPKYLTEASESEIVEIININVGAVTLMCRSFIEDMKKRRRGAIVNVSSISELMPVPLVTVYAATKAYIKSFSAALRYEYRGYGVTIQHLSPSFVDTKMNSFSKRVHNSRIIVPSSEEYASYAVATLGKMDESTGHWVHGIQYFFATMLPVWIGMHLAAQIAFLLRKDYFKENRILDKHLEDDKSKVS